MPLSLVHIRDRRRHRCPCCSSIISAFCGHTHSPASSNCHNPATSSYDNSESRKGTSPNFNCRRIKRRLAYFLTRWQDYVEATKIEGKDLIIQLLECCDEQLRKDLTRNAGGSLTNNTASEVLAAVKKLAVREENTMVARVQLHNMRQDRDETIRSFGARLRGQAGVCKF